jgi:NADH dehydrogenase
MSHRHRVVVVGAGFGGLAAAKALHDAPVDVTLVDANNFHTFQPLLYQVATAGLDADDVAFPARGIFHRQRNVDFRMERVTDVDLGRRVVRLAEG